MISIFNPSKNKLKYLKRMMVSPAPVRDIYMRRADPISTSTYPYANYQKTVLLVLQSQLPP